MQQICFKLVERFEAQLQFRSANGEFLFMHRVKFFIKVWINIYFYNYLMRNGINSKFVKIFVWKYWKQQNIIRYNNIFDTICYENYNWKFESSNSSIVLLISLSASNFNMMECFQTELYWLGWKYQAWNILNRFLTEIFL